MQRKEQIKRIETIFFIVISPCVVFRLNILLYINKKMLEKTLKKINELNNFISYLENVKTVYNNMYSGIKEGVNNG